MKKSKEYSKKVKKLYNYLKRTSSKPEKVTYDDPVDAIIYATIAEKFTQAEAESAMKRFAEHFVDWNDLRVSRTEEILEVLGRDSQAARDTASAVTRALMAIFGRYNAVSLQSLKRIGKRQAKQILEKMDGVSHFAVNYCMLTALGGHAICLTQKMIEHLRAQELVEAEADEQQIEGFLTRLISAENAYEFYRLLRGASEGHAGKKKTKRKPKGKTARKVRSKTTTKTRKRTNKSK